MIAYLLSLLLRRPRLPQSPELRVIDTDAAPVWSSPSARPLPPPVAGTPRRPDAAPARASTRRPAPEHLAELRRLALAELQGEQATRGRRRGRFRF